MLVTKKSKWIISTIGASIKARDDVKYSQSSDGINSCTHLNFQKFLSAPVFLFCISRGEQRAVGQAHPNPMGLVLQHIAICSIGSGRKGNVWGDAEVKVLLALSLSADNSTEKCWKWCNIRTRYFLTHRLCHNGSAAALAMPGMEERECLMRSSGERESELFWIKINTQDVKLGHRENQIENKNRKES